MQQDQFDLSLYKDDMMTQPEEEEGLTPGKKKELTARVNRIRKRLWKSFKLNCLNLPEKLW